MSEIDSEIALLATDGDLERGALRRIRGASVEYIAQDLTPLGCAAQAPEETPVSALTGAREAKHDIETRLEAQRLALSEQIDVLEVADLTQLDRTDLCLVCGEFVQFQRHRCGSIGRPGQDSEYLLLVALGERAGCETAKKVALPKSKPCRPLVDALLQKHRDPLFRPPGGIKLRGRFSPASIVLAPVGAEGRYRCVWTDPLASSLMWDRLSCMRDIRSPFSRSPLRPARPAGRAR